MKEASVRAYLPEPIYHTLADLEILWGVNVSEVRQLLIHGELKAHVWLPMMSVYDITEEQEGERVMMTCKLRHWEGYAPVFAHHCRSLFKRGKIHLREFAKGERNGRYRLPDSAEDFTLLLADLIVLREERARFEKRCAIQKDELTTCGDDARNFDPTFRNVRLDGADYRFGDIQAAILCRLHEAGGSRNQWQNGKQILREAGSESYTISNVFKRNPIWKRLIVSDGRGRYRASDELLRINPKNGVVACSNDANPSSPEPRPA